MASMPIHLTCDSKEFEAAIRKSHFATWRFVWRVRFLFRLVGHSYHYRPMIYTKWHT